MARKKTSQVGVVASKQPEVAIPTKKKKKSSDIYDKEEPISCKSVTVGELFMVGKKTGELYRWSNFGDVSEVEYQDLKAAKLAKSKLVYSPHFVIEDSDLLDNWVDVAEVYENMFDEDDIKKLFELPTNSLRKELEKLPKGLKLAVARLAVEAVKQGKFDRISSMKVFDEVLGTDLQFLVE